MRKRTKNTAHSESIFLISFLQVSLSILTLNCFSLYSLQVFSLSPLFPLVLSVQSSSPSSSSSSSLLIKTSFLNDDCLFFFAVLLCCSWELSKGDEERKKRRDENLILFILRLIPVHSLYLFLVTNTRSRKKKRTKTRTCPVFRRTAKNNRDKSSMISQKSQVLRLTRVSQLKALNSLMNIKSCSNVKRDLEVKSKTRLNKIVSYVNLSDYCCGLWGKNRFSSRTTFIQTFHHQSSLFVWSEVERRRQTEHNTLDVLWLLKQQSMEIQLSIDRKFPDHQVLLTKVSPSLSPCISKASQNISPGKACDCFFSHESKTV